MAFISASDVKKIRDALKARFPEIKFSVRGEHYSSVSISIMEGPYRFTEGDYAQLNTYHPDRYAHADILREIREIADTAGDKKNYDRSDIMTDYFDVGYYVHINQGKWDRPFVQTSKRIGKKAPGKAAVKRGPAQDFIDAMNAGESYSKVYIPNEIKEMQK